MARTDLLPTDRVAALRMIAQAEFRDFTKEDWMAYQGCEAPVPMIAERFGGDLVIIIDGGNVAFIQADPETCEIEDRTFHLASGN